MFPMSSLLIRAARPSDGEALAALYAPYARDTAITFEYEVPDAEEFTARIRRTLARYPFLVAEREGKPVGFVYASPFKNRAAYDWAVETSIYVAKDAHGEGIGRRLYEALEGALKPMGITNLNACIACPVREDEFLTFGSIRFHERQGYRMVGKFTRCGYKFGRWYDMVWMEKWLAAGEGAPQPVIPFLSAPEGSGVPGPVLSVMDDPMTVLVFALIVGFVQILVGMIVKFWMLCRAGQVWDAVWDIGTWWVIFLGIGLFALNMTGVTALGSVGGVPVVLIAGCLMLLAQARTAKGFGKVTAVISAVYNGVTGYFGDILSYSRLMVMMLAGSVIGQVFNILAAMPGGGLPPVVGIPVFFLIVIVGHAFNIGLNVIGTYVHTSRLQYLEFFKQFYAEGGRPWRPLNIATKFVDIKEEE